MGGGEVAAVHVQHGEVVVARGELALGAVFFALELNERDGGVPVASIPFAAGGGVALIRAQSSLDSLKLSDEQMFGVNHLGHFLLARLLEQRLIESAPARVVVVASRRVC